MLTYQQVKNLPFSLKICFYLYPWGEENIVENLSDWLELFGHTFSNNNLDELLKSNIITAKGYEEKCLDNARREYLKLYEFIVNFFE